MRILLKSVTQRSVSVLNPRVEPITRSMVSGIFYSVNPADPREYMLSVED